MIKTYSKPTRFRVQCKYCLSVIEFEESDIEKNTSTSKTRWIHCPNCGSEIYVKGYFGEFLNTVDPVR